MKSLYLIVQRRRHELISSDGKSWELVKWVDCYILKTWGCQTLDYWKVRGVIED